MKAVAKMEEVYSISVGDATVTGLRVKSRWNGMAELVDDLGAKLIVMGLDKSLGSIMSDILGNKESEITIVSASPDLLAALALEEEAKNV